MLESKIYSITAYKPTTPYYVSPTFDLMFSSYRHIGLEKTRESFMIRDLTVRLFLLFIQKRLNN